MKIEFKTATKQDLPEILQMMEEFYAIDSYTFHKNVTEKNILQFLTEPQFGTVWTINSADSILGYIVFTIGYSFEHGGRFGLLDEFFLKAEHRGKGLGKLVMRFIDEQAQKLNIGVVLLEVEKHNAAGLKLYSTNGYVQNGRLLLTKKLAASPSK